MADFLQLVFSGLATGAIYALAALGFTLLWQASGTINFARDVFKLLRKLADGGTTVLMIEQNVKSALKMADEAIALESGRLMLHKRADDLLADPNIERLFLGGAHAAASASV
jgi:ABC-type cobalamin transport system ATPase subunit